MLTAFFSPKMKMADLVEADCHLLSLLLRLGITSSFGERTIEDICRKHDMDAGTFCLICSVYSLPGYKPEGKDLDGAVIEDIVRYLHCSHEYYVNSALSVFGPRLEALLSPCAPAQKRAVWKFFAEYERELRAHFEYEEKSVFPYIHLLLEGGTPSEYSIEHFEENHSNVDEKLGDLKNILMKSLPAECDGAGRIDLLDFIFHLQKDLERHTSIEENVLVPVVRRLENTQGRRGTLVREPEASPQRREGLSEREQEVLLNVAQGLLNKEIADKLNISIHTVISHRKNITRKTGIKTVAGLTVYAILNGLIDVNSIE